MKSVFHLVALFLCTACAAHVADESKVMPKVTALPMALSDDFEFRKVKLFSLGKTTSEATKSANRRLSGEAVIEPMRRSRSSTWFRCIAAS